MCQSSGEGDSKCFHLYPQPVDPYLINSSEGSPAVIEKLSESYCCCNLPATADEEKQALDFVDPAKTKKVWICRPCFIGHLCDNKCSIIVFQRLQIKVLF